MRDKIDHDIVATIIESSISYFKQKSLEVYLWKQANLYEMSNALLDFLLTAILLIFPLKFYGVIYKISY